MSEFARRVYNSNKPNRNRTETPEDKAYRLAREYNSILRMVEQVNDARSYLQCRNTIASYGREVGKNSLDVMKLNGKLNERIKVVTNETQASIDRLSSDIDKIKNEKFEEPVEVLRELNVKAEQRLLQFMMQLGTNNTGNRRRVGNWVVQADRADACALMKLASLPQYMNYFTTKQREIILEKSKSEAEVIWERNKEPLIAEKNARLGQLYMKSLNVRNVLKKVSNAEGYYFKEGEV